MRRTLSKRSKQERSDLIDGLPAWLRFILHWYWAAFAPVAGSYVVGGILDLIQHGGHAAFIYFTSWALLAPIAARFPQLFVCAVGGLLALAVVSFVVFLHEREKAPQPKPKEPSGLIVNVPPEYRLFTGREDLLKRLHDAFNKGNIPTRTGVALGISGLGGMGKTQTAIEYAHRYRPEYKNVFWAKADSAQNLRTDFLSFAEQLNLPEKDNKDPQRVVDAVKHWLSNHAGWLLVFDNADEPEVVEDFLPVPNRGHTLLTTRAKAFERIAEPVEILPMTDDEGTRFLLHRAGIHEPTAADQSDARAIVHEVGGLPLAIEQAGAYIAETQCSLVEYVKLYKTHRAELLRQYKPPDYPYPVATTWLLSSKVQGANPASLELLRLCAFLDPDAIPEEVFAGGTPALGPVLGPISSDPAMMNAIFAALSRFSLIRRNANAKTLTIHRLVQDVIRDDMEADARRTWAERAIRAVTQAFPKNIRKPEDQLECRRLLPHALACAELVKTYAFAFPEAATLLNQAGTYLRAQSRFKEAEPLLLQALNIRENTVGSDDPSTVQSLDSLARFYFDQYLYAKAEPLYQRALAIREQALQRGQDQGEQQLELRRKAIADSLNRLGLNYWYRGERDTQHREQFYEEADQLYRRALSISTSLPITEDLPRLKALQLTLNIRNNQALLYRSQGKYEDAIAVNQEVLAERRKILADPQEQGKSGQEEEDVAQSLQNLGVTYYKQGDVSTYAEAERLLEEALKIREKIYPEKHVQIARCLRYLAQVYLALGTFEEAAKCYKRALAIWEESLADRSQIIEARREYVDLLRKMGRDKEAASEEAKIKADLDRASSQE